MSKKPKQTHLRLTPPPKHDAGIFRDGMYFEPSRWSRSAEPRRRLAEWKRLGIAAACAVTGMCALLHPVITGIVLLFTAAPVIGAGGALCFRRWQAWPHTRAVVKPIAVNVGPLIDQDARRHRSWLAIPEDYGTREDGLVGTVEVPPEVILGDRDIEEITLAFTAKTGIASPIMTPRLNSRFPQLAYHRNDPPPLSVSLADIRPYIETAKPSEVILGLPRGSEPVRVDLDSETPHVGVSIKTNGGKSELLKNIAAQALYHGAIVMILDYKLTSHMWADRLPSVSYARTPQEIQEALLWLAWDDYDADGNIIRRSELTRRKDVVLAARRRGEKPNPGPRIVVIAEERNATSRALRRFHKRMGGRGSSPALEALDETGETGRFIRLNAMHAFQRMSAKASGSDGSRDAMENICGTVTKDPDDQTWKLVGRGHAQPPRSGHKGRYQWITDAGVTDFQGVLYDKDVDESDRIARELAMSGEIGVPPHDMPFVYRSGLLVPAGIGQGELARQEGSEQAFGLTQDAPVLTAGEGPTRAVTLAEAVAAGIFVSISAARKAAQRQGWEPVGGDRYTTGYTYAVKDIHEYLAAKGKR